MTRSVCSMPSTSSLSLGFLRIGKADARRPGFEGHEAVPADEEPAERPAKDAAGDEAKCRGGGPDLERIGQVELRLKRGAQAIAVPWPPDRPIDPASRPVAGFAPNRVRDANADAVLDPEVGDGDDREERRAWIPGDEHAHVWRKGRSS